MGCPSSVVLGGNLIFSICTHDADTGALTDTSAPPTYRIYVNETGAAIASGTMTVLDTGNTTGFYTELLACTTGNGYAVETGYTIYIEATVDGITGGISYGFTVDTPAAALVDAVWDEVLTGATHNVATSAGRRLRTASGGQLDSGQAQAGGPDTITLATSASTTVGIYVGCQIAIDGGTGAGQSRYIVGYTAGRIAHVARHWTIAPDNTSTYVLYADNQVMFVYIGLATAGGASSITLGAGASATNSIYDGQAIRILSGTGDDQIRVITAYDGGTKVATVDRPWTTVPDATSYFGTLTFGPGYDTAADTLILADTNDIQSRIPAALTGAGNIKSEAVVVSDKTDYAIGIGGITATSFAAGAIDESAIASNAITSNELAQSAGQKIADEVLNRDIAGSASGGSRNVRSALRRLRNRVAVAAGTATVYQENDSTAAWTAVVSTVAGDPVSEVDPA